MNQMKALSGGQREFRHLPSCVTHLFVYACLHTWTASLYPKTCYTMCICILELFKAYWSYLMNLLLSPNCGRSCNVLLCSSAHWQWIHCLPQCLQSKPACYCVNSTLTFAPEVLRWHWFLVILHWVTEYSGWGLPPGGLVKLFNKLIQLFQAFISC